MAAKKFVTPLWRWQAAAAVLMLAITLTGLAPKADPLLVFCFGVALMTALFWLGVRAWRDLDEVAREAQKSAWLWGARIGAGVNAVLILALMSNAGDAWLPARFTPSTYIALGVAASALPSIIAYQICWSVWWFRRR